MSWGEVQKKTIKVMTEPVPVPDLPIDDNPLEYCCFKLPVFADVGVSDKFQNDTRAEIFLFPEFIPTINIELEKVVDGVWTNQTTLIDDSYGTYYAPGFVTRNNNQYVGYDLNFRDVLIAFGAGKYRLNFEAYNGGVLVYQRTSLHYCLSQFTNAAADGTVRIDYTLNSVIGDSDQTTIRDFVGLEWTSQTRVPNSIFGFKKAGFEVESVKYQTGKEVSYKKGNREEYRLEINGIPNEYGELLLYDVLMADDIYITDYNSQNNSGQYAELNVEINGGYEPNYGNLRTNLTMEIPFIDKFNRRNKKYS